MSPKIGLTIATRGMLKDRSTPAAKVFASIQMMSDSGVRLRYGDYGVLPCPFAGGWCIDVRTGSAVNVAGAVLLALQPEAGPDPGAAVAELLEVPRAYVEGLGDGWDRARQSAEWMGSVHVVSYLDGYEIGMEARFRATVICRCGTRRWKAEPCATCANQPTGKSHK